MADKVPDLEWTPYADRGARLRVRDIIVRGSTEYELCSEGGQMLIRRTVRRNGNALTSEAGRGLSRETCSAWLLLVRLTAPGRARV